MTYREAANVMTTRTISRTLVTACLMVCGCQNLEVTNPNAVTLATTLSVPQNLQTTAGSSFKYLWAMMQSDDPRQGVTFYPGVSLGGAGDMITAANNVDEFQDGGGRPALTYDNTQAGNWLTREQMANYFTAISGCADVIRAVNLNGIKIGPITPAFPQGAHTQQAKWFCKFIEGAATIEMAFQYDKAVLVYDTLPATDIYSTDFKTPAQQIAWGLKLLQQAIDSAKPTCATPPVAPCVPLDPTPTTWVNGFSYTNYDIIKLASGFKARALVYTIRTDDDWRAAATRGDWNNVIAYVDSGMTGAVGGAYSYLNTSGLAQGFISQAVANIQGAREYSSAITSLNSFPGTGTPSNTACCRISQEFLGPGDTTTAYLWWRALSDSGNLVAMHDTTYESPDLRLPRFNGPVTATTLTPIAGTGKYYGRLSNTYPSTAAYFPWANTRYYSVRFQSVTTYNTLGVVSTMRPEEMDLLKAEALIRTGNIGAAVVLINKTRVSHGGLSALPATMTTSTPIPGSPPGVAGPACVPRSYRDPTQCGTIMDALLWERRLELGDIETDIIWEDWRRFGMLRPGNMISLPIHSRELFALHLPYYTYGGTLPGSVGVAGTPYVTRGKPGDGSSLAWLY